MFTIRFPARANCKVVPLAPWWSDDPHRKVTKVLALDLLSLLAKVNDCAIMLCVAAEVVQGAKDALPKAKLVQVLRATVASAYASWDPMAEALGALPLKRSSALVGDWMRCVKAFGEKLMDLTMDGYCAFMLGASKTLEASCPRWGTFITDSGVQGELVKLQLVDNVGIRSLPDLVRDLANCMHRMKLMGEAFKWPCPMDEAPSTRDGMRLCSNSFSFAKRTVNVAAACNILMDPQATLPSLDMVLGFRASFPGGLISRLESRCAALAEADGAGRVAKRKTASTVASSASAAMSDAGASAASSKTAKGQSAKKRRQS